MQENSVWNFGLVEVEIHMGHYDIRRSLHVSLTFLVLQQKQNLGQRFGTSKMHLRPPVT